MKHGNMGERHHLTAVASLAEAWIETLNANALSVALPVASLAEAWIEIISGDTTDLTSKVTSFAEAWIETRKIV